MSVFLMNSVLSFDPRAFQIPATHRTIDVVHSRVIDERLNLRHFPARGILGMFMEKVFLHFHLQLVTLYTSSDLWLNFLCFQFADFSRCRTTRVQQRRKLISRWTSCKKFRLLSILHSSEFCSVIFKAEVPHRSVGSCSCQIHCEPFTKSKPRSDRRELRRIEHCCSFTRILLIREYAQLHDLVIVEIFNQAEWSE